MNFSVAIRAKKYALRDFIPYSRPTSRMPAIGDRKILSLVNQMVELERFGTLLIPTELALCPREADSHLADLFSSLLDGRNKI
jgi:hypothetical protein